MSVTFLCIETSTLNCSVAVFKDSTQVSLIEESSDKYIHGERLHLFIERAVKEASITLSDLQAIVVSKGPGSYTGLRIGVSAAKGLCFALSIPLYSLESLQILAQSQRFQCSPKDRLLSLIDARRMEVYSGLYTHELEQIGETRAEIVESDTFDLRLPEGKLILVGDAQEKLKNTLINERFVFTSSVYPSAAYMGRLGLAKIESGKDESVAYFEPFYLKDFVAGTPRKSPLASQSRNSQDTM